MKIYPYSSDGIYLTLRCVTNDYPMIRYLEQYSEYDEDMDQCIYYYKILPITESALIIYVDFMIQYILVVEDSPGNWESSMSQDTLIDCLKSKGQMPFIDYDNLNSEVYNYFKENFQMLLDFMKKEGQSI